MSPPRVSLQLIDGSRVPLLEDRVWRKLIALLHPLEHPMQDGANHGFWARCKALVTLEPASGRNDQLQATVR